MKKLLSVMTAISSFVLADSFSMNIYVGVQDGNWRLRGSEKSEVLNEGAYNLAIELDKKLYNHIYLLGGIGYENGFELKDNSGSYDIIPVYIGGRYEYYTKAVWNPYITGRIGYPIFTDKDTVKLDKGQNNGWANVGIGLLYKNFFMAELGYKQHITNYTLENNEYDARFVSLNLGYRIK